MVKTGNRQFKKKEQGTNTSGVYSVSIKAQKKGTVISVTAKDKAGNISAAATYTVVKH